MISSTAIPEIQKNQKNAVFFEFWQSSKENWWEDNFLNFLNLARKFKKFKKNNWPFFLDFLNFGNPQKKTGGKSPFEFFAFPGRSKFKKFKKNWSFFLIFLNFGNPQKKTCWEEYFFKFFEFPNSKKNKRLAVFFEFFEFWQSSKRKLVARVTFFFNFFEFPKFKKKTKKFQKNMDSSQQFSF